ncbi:hypothetical protein EC988_006455 [Linderina pennispora]|nr:hypothetical protein EC988_006455 [Linderina pennispora]
MSANDMDLDIPETQTNVQGNSINTPPQSAGHTPQRPTAFGRVDSGTAISRRTRAADSAAPESPHLGNDDEDMAMEFEDSRSHRPQRRGRNVRMSKALAELSQTVHNDFPNEFGDNWHIVH